MIRKVTLENFRSHRNSEFVFSRGTNVLVGKMGSGKTSVANAICFSLFGTFPELEAKKVRLEEIISSKPNQAEKAAVKTEFDYSEKNYAVERTISAKGSQAKLYCEGRMIAGPQPTQVTRAIEDLLQMNYDLFSRAVYAEQNQIDYFLKLAPQKRREQIDELLGINKYELARANANSLKKQLDGISREKREYVSQWEKSDPMREISEQEKRLAEKAGMIVSLEKESKALAESARKSAKEFAEMESQRKAFAGAREKMLKLEAGLGQAKRTLESMAKEIGNEIPSESEAKKNAEEAGKAVTEAGKAEESARKRFGEIDRELAVLQANIRAIEKGASELKKISSACPTCGRPLAEHDKEELLKERKAKIAEAEKSLLGAMAKRKSLEEEEGAATAQKKLATEDERKSRRMLDAARQNAEANETEKELEKARKEIEGIKFDEMAFGEKRNKANSEAERQRQKETELRHAREMQKEIAERLEIARKEIERIEKAKSDLKKAEEKREKLGLFISALMKTQNDLRETMISAVNLAMDDIWPKLYPYRDFETARIIVKEGDYEIMVRNRNGKWVNAEGMLSGGERSAVALTVRIAISLVLTRNLSWLILDEPTHNLDSKAVEVFAELLRNHLPLLVEQVFVITHEHELEKAASASLYELDRNKDLDASTSSVAMETG
ncbi:MAG: AAA family ATPase [archaeon]